MDGLVLVALVCPMPGANALAATARRWAVFALLSVASIAVAVVLFVAARPGRLSADGRIQGDAATVVLRPEEWIGQPCPLIGHMDIGRTLEEGEWMVLLYHPKCSECQEMLPRYIRQAGEDRSRPRSPRWALVEVPDGEDGAEYISVGSPLVCGSLSKVRRWVVRTPVILRLEDGVVTAVTHSPEEIHE